MIYIDDTNRKIKIQAHSAKSTSKYTITLINGITQAEYTFADMEDDGTTAYYIFQLTKSIVAGMPNGEYFYSLYQGKSQLCQGVLVKHNEAEADFYYDVDIDDYEYEEEDTPQYNNAILFDDGSILSFDNNSVIIYN